MDVLSGLGGGIGPAATFVGGPSTDGVIRGGYGGGSEDDSVAATLLNKIAADPKSGIQFSDIREDFDQPVTGRQLDLIGREPEDTFRIHTLKSCHTDHGSGHTVKVLATGDLEVPGIQVDQNGGLELGYDADTNEHTLKNTGVLSLTEASTAGNAVALTADGPIGTGNVEIYVPTTTLVAGSGISITQSGGVITISATGNQGSEPSGGGFSPTGLSVSVPIIDSISYDTSSHALKMHVGSLTFSDGLLTGYIPSSSSSTVTVTTAVEES